MAEIGDKTQLLAFLLAARCRKPWPIILGILVATLVNHGLAGVVGAWVTTLLAPETLRWLLIISFIAMAVWILIPDKLDDVQTNLSGAGVFLTTLVTFFLAEMGDKTQVATVALAAHYQGLVMVVLGTTIGMMIANVPAVLLGDRIADRMPTRLVHVIAACVFLLLAAALLLNLDGMGGQAG